jgi:hypothetical protein
MHSYIGIWSDLGKLLREVQEEERDWGFGSPMLNLSRAL